MCVCELVGRGKKDEVYGTVVGMEQNQNSFLSCPPPFSLFSLKSVYSK